MKKILVFSLIFLFCKAPVFASINIQTTGDSDVTVNQETEGESTICVNGKCTTTGGGSKTTACISGKCYESEDGNLNIEEGSTKINIKNSNSTQNNTPSQTEIDGDDLGVSINGDGEIKGASDAAEEMKAQQKNVIQKIFDQISKFFQNLFNFF